MIVHELLVKAIQQEYEDQLVRRQKMRQLEKAWWAWDVPNPSGGVSQKALRRVVGAVYRLVARLQRSRRGVVARRKAPSEALPIP